MRIYSGIAGSARRLTRGALAIGNFDGVHLGHRGLFDAAKASARKLGGPSSVLTFEPHPARLLAPEYAPPLISSPARKLELLAEAGVEELVVQPFDRAFAGTEPERFVDLLAATGAYEVVVGHDFTYGRERGGTVDTLGASLTRRRRMRRGSKTRARPMFRQPSARRCPGRPTSASIPPFATPPTPAAGASRSCSKCTSSTSTRTSTAARSGWSSSTGCATSDGSRTSRR